MENAQALAILRALADGRDPLTGSELQPESCFQSPQIIRALHRAVLALEDAEHRERVSRAGTHAGQPWSVAEDEQLCREFQTRVSFDEMARTHQRSRGAIIARLERLGKLKPHTVSGPIAV